MCVTHLQSAIYHVTVSLALTFLNRLNQCVDVVALGYRSALNDDNMSCGGHKETEKHKIKPEQDSHLSRGWHSYRRRRPETFIEQDEVTKINCNCSSSNGGGGGSGAQCGIKTKIAVSSAAHILAHTFIRHQSFAWHHKNYDWNWTKFLLRRTTAVDDDDAMLCNDGCSHAHSLPLLLLLGCH